VRDRALRGAPGAHSKFSRYLTGGCWHFSESVIVTTNRLTIKYFRVASFQLNPQNPRVQNDKHVSKLATSIRISTFNVPFLIDDQANRHRMDRGYSY
jgi:hypothetical protein